MTEGEGQRARSGPADDVRRLLLALFDFLVNGEPVVLRSAARVTALAFVGLSVGVAVVARKPVALVPVGVTALLVAEYVAEVGRGRRILLAAVSRGAMPPLAPSDALLVVGRARSLVGLARAFAAILEHRDRAAEDAIGALDREELGPWEGRVLEAVRALVAIERGDRRRAAQLAPLAIPTENAAVDVTLAQVMLRGSWRQPARLRAMRPTLGRAPHLAVFVHLIDARLGVLENTAWRVPRTIAGEVSEAARTLGDGSLADAVLADAERRGAYR